MPRALPMTPEEARGRYSMRERLTLLIGDRLHLVVWLGVTSIISAILEATLLTVVSEIGLDLVGSKKVIQHSSRLSVLHLPYSVGTLILVAFGLAMGRLVLQLPLATLPSKIAADVQARIRRELFQAFTVASWNTQSREREGALQETMTGQVMQATSGAVQATGLMSSGFTFLVLLAYAFALFPAAASVVLLASLVLFVLLRPLNQLGARRAAALSRSQMDYAGGVGQANRLAEETKVFGVGEAQRDRVQRLIDVARMWFYRTQVVGRLTPAIFQSAMLLILVGLLEFVHTAGTSKITSLTAVILLLTRAGTYGQAVQGAWQSLRQSLPFIERLQDTRDRYRASAYEEGSAPLPSVTTIAFDDVSFSYNPARPVLEDVSFEVLGGESIGVIGPSGAGKSTLIALLLGLRRPVSGSYLINGGAASSYSSVDWHRLIAYVPQEPRLLHDTVAENIRYMRDFEDAAVERAARLARIHEEVVSWPDGYETIVGPRADAVSGGQQQRICLARALVGNPQVLVLDEPTSALDPHSESLIQESLTALREELTLFVIAHRMSTLEICDRVMVIVDGRLVGFDAQARLQVENPYYRHASQIAFGGGDR
jgi:ATP-binding cassette, subfamily B, bacterial